MIMYNPSAPEEYQNMAREFAAQQQMNPMGQYQNPWADQMGRYIPGMSQAGPVQRPPMWSSSSYQDSGISQIGNNYQQQPQTPPMQYPRPPGPGGYGMQQWGMQQWPQLQQPQQPPMQQPRPAPQPQQPQRLDPRQRQQFEQLRAQQAGGAGLNQRQQTRMNYLQAQRGRR